MGLSYNDSVILGIPYTGYETAIRLAVIAHIRHAETEYDALLERGYERWEAREHVAKVVDQVLSRWKTPA